MYSYGVFIGRFQPFHVGHLHNIAIGLESCEKLIILIGSAFRARTIKNPFTFAERKQMILADLMAVNPDWRDRIIVEPVSDWFYDEQAWIDEVRSRVEKHAAESSVAIVGHEKDASSYYLHCFKNWGFVEVSNFKEYNATEFREAMFHSQKLLTKDYLVNVGEESKNTSYHFLSDFMKGKTYRALLSEYHYLQDYKASWRHGPFPPVFVTLDALVTCNNHILLVQRKHCPGKGLWALPGGFLDQDERIEDGVFRELVEETNIDVSLDQLRKSLKGVRVFDYPERSLRGRIITHVGQIKLNSKHELPKISAADDAEDARWVLFDDFWKMSEQMIDDHYQIVRVMLKSEWSKNGK